MLADILPTPTFAADYLYFGPLGVVVGLVMLALAIVAGRAVRRQGLAAAILVGVVTFVALDLVCFFVGLHLLSASYDRPLPPDVAPKAGSPGQAP